jgi:hypothetical protein
LIETESVRASVTERSNHRFEVGTGQRITLVEPDSAG